MPIIPKLIFSPMIYGAHGEELLRTRHHIGLETFGCGLAFKLGNDFE